MKKIKLIKLYPGSPNNLGITLTPKVDIDNNDANNFYWEGSWFNPNHYPEYWEEIIEKDYEILSYIKKGSTTCTTTKRRGGELHDEYWNIHSVKRLSDGEVFTVGDRVKVYEHGSIKTITEIVVNDTKSLVKEGIWIRYDYGSSHMTHAIKVEQPIFLTHDGKDIFAGDKVHYVNKVILCYSFLIPISSTIFYSDINAYFLTKEAAKDYIVLNSRALSLEDYENAFTSQHGTYNIKLYLAALVKQRLKIE
jgi:hypothetical protein